MPLELQPKLLRVLESEEIRPRRRRTSTSKVDVRIVAATNRDLRVEVNEAGASVQDLYYRLAVRPHPAPAAARLAPRRICRARRALPRAARRDASATDARCVTAGAARALLARTRGPATCASCENYLERSLVFQEPQPLGETTAPSSIQGGIEVNPSLPYAEARQRALEAFERTYVRGLIERHAGKVSAAAAAAGTGRVYLYKLARRHGIKPG